MKKKWLVVMLVSFLSVFVLFGCLPAQTEGEPEEQPEEQPVEPVMLKAYLPESTPATATIYLVGSYSNFEFTDAATSEVKVDGDQMYAEFDISTLFTDEDYPVKYKYAYDEGWDFQEADPNGNDFEFKTRRLDVPPQIGVEDVVLNWKGMDPIDYTDLQEEITVNFIVHVPEGTEGDAIYMRGWNGDWGNSITLEKDVDTGYYTTEATTTSYTAQGYKFLRMDDWAYVEKDAEGDEIGNRTYVLTDDATIVNVVESWAQ